MKVILFGATGMVGQGVLRECLLDPQVETVLAVGRSATGQRHAKLREVVHGTLTDLASVEDQLHGYDACFFCLGASSAGMSEAGYRRVTYDLTVTVGQTLSRLNPGMTFIYVSGAGTDSTEHGRSMWARVKGQTENALLRMPFKAAYMFRPGVIRPLHGIRSKTRSYRVLYTVLAPFVLLAAAVAPNSITTTEKVGRAMIHTAQHGAPKALLSTREINQLAK
ncbi:MAG TPA: NAD(P)H-binding protein [Thermoplasmata archaeon]|jgi:uncharacterized protein YbjT (DUF2867 family)